VADVLKHIASVFGEAIVGKYGYSKAFIDGVVYRVYGELEPPSLVLPGLWLGSEYNAADLAELQRCGVSHVLNVAVEIDRFFPERFTYMKVHIVDEPDANLLPFFDRACEFIDAALSKGTGVLVGGCRQAGSGSGQLTLRGNVKGALPARSEQIGGLRRGVRDDARRARGAGRRGLCQAAAAHRQAQQGLPRPARALGPKAPRGAAASLRRSCTHV
jgi:hypothetical protein